MPMQVTVADVHELFAIFDVEGMLKVVRTWQISVKSTSMLL